MKYLFCSFPLGLLRIVGCQDKSTTKTPTAKEKKAAAAAKESPKDKYLNDLEQIAQTVSESTNRKTGDILAKALVSESIRFAEKYEGAEEVPAVLFRAGEVARSLGEYEQSIDIFSKIHTNFPDSPFAVKALFLEASAFEDGLEDKEQAQLRYESLIEKYPDDLLADQARQLLEVIDKTPEELIQEFKNQ